MLDERLIREVERHAVIYNRQKSNNFHGDKSTNKELAWLKIALTLSTDSDTCKKRWKYLRERYVQQKKTGDSPSFEHLSRPYLEKMRFLDNFIQPRKSYRNAGGAMSLDSTSSGNRTAFGHQQHHNLAIDNNNSCSLAQKSADCKMPNAVAVAAAANRMHVTQIMQQFATAMNNGGGCSSSGVHSTNSSSSFEQMSGENMKLFDHFSSLVQQKQPPQDLSCNQFENIETDIANTNAASNFPINLYGRQQSAATTSEANNVPMLPHSNDTDADYVKNEPDASQTAVADAVNTSGSSLMSAMMLPLSEHQRDLPPAHINSSGSDTATTFDAADTLHVTAAEIPSNGASVSTTNVTNTSKIASAQLEQRRRRQQNQRRQRQRTIQQQHRQRQQNQQRSRLSTTAAKSEENADGDRRSELTNDDEDTEATLHERLRPLPSSTFPGDFLYPFYPQATGSHLQPPDQQKHPQLHHHHQHQSPAAQQARNSEQLLGELVTSELLKMDRDRRRAAQKKILEILFFTDD